MKRQIALIGFFVLVFSFVPAAEASGLCCELTFKEVGDDMLDNIDIRVYPAQRTSLRAMEKCRYEADSEFRDTVYAAYCAAVPGPTCTVNFHLNDRFALLHSCITPDRGSPCLTSDGVSVAEGSVLCRGSDVLVVDKAYLRLFSRGDRDTVNPDELRP